MYCQFFVLSKCIVSFCQGRGEAGTDVRCVVPPVARVRATDFVRVYVASLTFRHQRPTMKPPFPSLWEGESCGPWATVRLVGTVRLVNKKLLYSTFVFQVYHVLISSFAPQNIATKTLHLQCLDVVQGVSMSWRPSVCIFLRGIT